MVPCPNVSNTCLRPILRWRIRIQLSKEMEKCAAEEDYEIFSEADEINLELDALDEYMIERMDELVY